MYLNALLVGLKNNTVCVALAAWQDVKVVKAIGNCSGG